MTKNEFKCDICLNIYEKGWSDEESAKEAKEIWGEIPQNEQCVICDDCFNKRSYAEIKEMGEEYKKSNDKNNQTK